MHLDASPTAGDLVGIDPDDLTGEYARRRLGALSDEQLFDAAAAVVGQPKAEPASSFILHAPLELLARRALLRIAAPDRRDALRERIVSLAATYERAADPVVASPPAAFASPAAAVSALTSAIREKDLDQSDAAASWLAHHGSADDVMALAPSTTDSLAAAGHASIYFFHLARTAMGNRAALGLLRPLVREVARLPELRIEWVRDRIAATGDDGAAFARALAATPRLGLPGSDFIFPTVHQVDHDGPARALITATLPRDHATAASAILRTAAHSMLQDEPNYAPYGWSHCLTLPQSVLGITRWLPNQTTATAIAATYVVAFRAAQSSRDIDVTWAPEPDSAAFADVIQGDPTAAASAAYHAPDHEVPTIISELAARAGAHPDAHLAKYTLACFDAAASDPSQRGLYLAAAAYLGARWARAA